MDRKITFKFYKNIHLMNVIVSFVILLHTPNNLFAHNLNLKSTPSMQKQEFIKGIVKDKLGNPIANATVEVLGSENKTFTDNAGQFTLPKITIGQQINISYIGFNTANIITTNLDFLTITLEESATLDEVVVTALGVSRQSRAVGYAIESIKSKDLTIAGQPNMALGLSGKVAGVQVSASSNGMDGSPRVLIRGISSLSNDNSPLWVIDGVPMQTNRVLNESLFAPTGFNDWGNSISDINTNDIESMTVLKGAAATALYGSRASNGAILVTTKNGAGGKKGWSVTLNNSTTFSNPLLLPKHQNLYGQGYDGEYEYVDGDGNGKGESGVAYGPSFIDPATGKNRLIAQYNSPIDPSTGKRIPTEFRAYKDNYKNFFKTGVDVNSALAISNVSEFSNTRISLSHNKVLDIIPNSQLTRINASVNSEMQLGSKLKASLMMLTSRMESPNRSNMGDGGVMEGLMYLPNSVDILDFKNNYKDEFGKPRSWNASSTNPYWNIYENINAATRDKFTGKVSLTYKITDNFNIQGNVYQDYNITNHEQHSAVWRYNDGSYTSGSDLNKEYNADLSINYSKTIKDFILSGNLSTAVRNERNIYRSAWTEGGLITPGVYNLANSKLAANTNYNYLEKEVQSVYGYLDFGYKNYLFLSFTGRNDWSSTLPSGNWSYFYPSVSTSIIVNELLHLDNNILSFFKIRANWAKVGNDTAPYQLKRYLNRGQDWVSPDGKEPVLGYENILPPIGLKPEEKNSWEIGADIRFLKNRIGLDIAYYDDLSKNQIIKAETPWEGGARHRMVNAGSLKTTGIEFKIDASIISKPDFDWNVALNWSTSKTKVLELYPGVDFLHISAFNGNEVRAMPGRRYGEVWGYTIVNDSQSFWDTYVNETNPWLQEMIGTTTPFGTGKDFVKDGMPMHTYWNMLPLPLYTTPDWLAGITNSFRYKNFDGQFTLDFRKGGYIASTSVLSAIQMGKDPSTVAVNANGVNIREPLTSGGGFIYDGTDIDTGQPNATTIRAQEYFDNWTTPTTQIAFKGDYIKLRELSLGYRLPKNTVQKIGLESIRLSVIGRNLWLIQSHLPGFDPETTGMGSGNSGVGVEYLSLPSTRNIGFNIQVTF